MRSPFSEAGYTAIQLLVAVGIIGVVSATAMPSTFRVLAEMRLSGDARDLHNTVGLAKMRAATRYTRERIYVDLTTNTYKLQYWDKTTSGWLDEQGSTNLSTSVSFGFGSTQTPPPNTQTAIGQSPSCTDNAGAAITGSACIIFNSRGVPVSSTGSPTGNSAFYLTDGGITYGVTLSATPLIRLWSTRAGTSLWVQR